MNCRNYDISTLLIKLIVISVICVFSATCVLGNQHHQYYKIEPSQSLGARQISYDPVNDIFVIAVSGSNRIYTWDPSSSTSSFTHIAGTGTAGNSNSAIGTLALLNSPVGVTMKFNSDKIFTGYAVSDTNNYCLREIGFGPSYAVSTMIGTCGTAGISGDLFQLPKGIDYHLNGKMWAVADSTAHVVNLVEFVEPSSAFVDTNILHKRSLCGVANTSGWSVDGSSASTALFDYPFAVALFPRADSKPSALFISEFHSARLRRLAPVSASSGTVSTIVSPPSSSLSSSQYSGWGLSHSYDSVSVAGIMVWYNDFSGLLLFNMTATEAISSSSEMMNTSSSTIALSCEHSSILVWPHLFPNLSTVTGTLNSLSTIDHPDVVVFQGSKEGNHSGVDDCFTNNEVANSDSEMSNHLVVNSVLATKNVFTIANAGLILVAVTIPPINTFYQSFIALCVSGISTSHVKTTGVHYGLLPFEFSLVGGDFVDEKERNSTATFADGVDPFPVIFGRNEMIRLLLGLGVVFVGLVVLHLLVVFIMYLIPVTAPSVKRHNNNTSIKNKQQHQKNATRAVNMTEDDRNQNNEVPTTRSLSVATARARFPSLTLTLLFLAQPGLCFVSGFFAADLISSLLLVGSAAENLSLDLGIFIPLFVVGFFIIPLIIWKSSDTALDRLKKREIDHLAEEREIIWLVSLMQDNCCQKHFLTQGLFCGPTARKYSGAFDIVTPNNVRSFPLLHSLFAAIVCFLSGVSHVENEKGRDVSLYLTVAFFVIFLICLLIFRPYRRPTNLIIVILLTLLACAKGLHGLIFSEDAATSIGDLEITVDDLLILITSGFVLIATIFTLIVSLLENTLWTKYFVVVRDNRKPGAKNKKKPAGKAGSPPSSPVNPLSGKPPLSPGRKTKKPSTADSNSNNNKVSSSQLMQEIINNRKRKEGIIILIDTDKNVERTPEEEAKRLQLLTDCLSDWKKEFVKRYEREPDEADVRKDSIASRVQEEYKELKQTAAPYQSERRRSRLQSSRESTRSGGGGGSRPSSQSNSNNKDRTGGDNGIEADFFNQQKEWKVKLQKWKTEFSRNHHEREPTTKDYLLNGDGDDNISHVFIQMAVGNYILAVDPPVNSSEGSSSSPPSTATHNNTNQRTTNHGRPSSTSSSQSKKLSSRQKEMLFAIRDSKSGEFVGPEHRNLEKSLEVIDERKKTIGSELAAWRKQFTKKNDRQPLIEDMAADSTSLVATYTEYQVLKVQQQIFQDVFLQLQEQQQDQEQNLENDENQNDSCLFYESEDDLKKDEERAAQLKKKIQKWKKVFKSLYDREPTREEAENDEELVKVGNELQELKMKIATGKEQMLQGKQQQPQQKQASTGNRSTSTTPQKKNRQSPTTTSIRSGSNPQQQQQRPASTGVLLLNSTNRESLDHNSNNSSGQNNNNNNSITARPKSATALNFASSPNSSNSNNNNNNRASAATTPQQQQSTENNRSSNSNHKTRPVSSTSSEGRRRKALTFSSSNKNNDSNSNDNDDDDDNNSVNSSERSSRLSSNNSSTNNNNNNKPSSAGRRSKKRRVTDGKSLGEQLGQIVLEEDRVKLRNLPPEERQKEMQRLLNKWKKAFIIKHGETASNETMLKNEEISDIYREHAALEKYHADDDTRRKLNRKLNAWRIKFRESNDGKPPVEEDILNDETIAEDYKTFLDLKKSLVKQKKDMAEEFGADDDNNNNGNGVEESVNNNSTNIKLLGGRNSVTASPPPSASASARSRSRLVSPSSNSQRGGRGVRTRTPQTSMNLNTNNNSTNNKPTSAAAAAATSTTPPLLKGSTSKPPTASASPRDGSPLLVNDELIQQQRNDELFRPSSLSPATTARNGIPQPRPNQLSRSGRRPNTGQTFGNLSQSFNNDDEYNIDGFEVVEEEVMDEQERKIRRKMQTAFERILEDSTSPLYGACDLLLELITAVEVANKKDLKTRKRQKEVKHEILRWKDAFKQKHDGREATHADIEQDISILGPYAEYLKLQFEEKKKAETMATFCTTSPISPQSPNLSAEQQQQQLENSGSTTKKMDSVGRRSEVLSKFEQFHKMYKEQFDGKAPSNQDLLADSSLSKLMVELQKGLWTRVRFNDQMTAGNLGLHDQTMMAGSDDEDE